MLETSRPYAVRTLSYGTLPSQEGDLYLPLGSRLPVVCLLHGGFWRMPYGRDELGAVAADLAARGFAVWNVEYRRLGAPGGGWPGTFHDVAAAIDHLEDFLADGVDLDLDRVTVAGHSAGGHLALWVAARNRPPALAAPARVRPFAVAGLAPISDLARTHAGAAGNGAVNELLGGSPGERPERYAAASPIEMLPLGVRQLIVHGVQDEALPIDMSRDYAAAARAAGDAVELVELPAAGHMDSVDPASAAHHALRDWLSGRVPALRG